MRNPTRRAGLTRPDVLVLLALGAAVFCLTVPAIGKVQEEASREKCRNNFKQLGQAAVLYANDHAGALPPVAGIIPQLLPYTEYRELAKALVDSGEPWYAPANAKVVAKHLAIAQCPATPNPERLISGQIDENDFKAAPTDYTAIPQITNNPAIRDLFPEGFDMTSTLAQRDRPTFGDVTDGLSTTLMGIVEIADKPNQWQAGKLVSRREAQGGNGTWVANGLNAPRGYTWDGTSFPGPCAMNCSNRAAIYSFHPDGCNFLFADGSVRFFNKDLDVWLFYAVVTRRGGELLTPSDF